MVLLQLLVIGLANGAAIALNAIGFTLVFAVTRTINFAHGDLFALTTVLVTAAVTQLGLHAALPGESPLPLAGGLLLTLAVAMAFGAALNAGIERAAFRPFRHGATGSRLAPLIATLGLSFILYEAALVWRLYQPSFVPREHRSVPGLPEVPTDAVPELLPRLDLIQTLTSRAAVSFTLKDALLIALAAGMALGVRWLLQRTRTGRAIRACAQNPDLARLCGINPDRATAAAFALGGALAGAAAFVFTLYYDHPFGQHGIESGLTAFAAAILGGAGRPLGALAGGLALGVVAAFSDYILAAQWTPVLVQLALIALLVLRPSGLGAEAGGEDRLTASPGDVVLEPVGGRADRPAHTRRALRWSAWALVALAVAYPLVDAVFGLGRQILATTLAVFVLAALGLDIVLGLAGLLDLGYAAGFGIGAYTAALLSNPWGALAITLPLPLDFSLIVAIGAALAALFGAFNGALARRLRGDYLAIATLALGEIAYRVAVNLPKVTGGTGGLSTLAPPRLVALVVNTPSARYYLALAPLLLAIVAAARLRGSRPGRAWRAMGEDEVAALSCGVDGGRARTTAFMLGTAVAGIAGAVYVGVLGYVDPEQIGFRVSAMLLAMVAAGGAGRIWGAVAGALLIGGLDRVVIPLLGVALDRFKFAPGGNGLVVFDVRGMSFLSFGAILYLTVLLRARPWRFQDSPR